MNETKSTVKTVLSFVLVLVLIVGTLFGIDVPYDENDIDIEGIVTEEPTVEDEQPETDDITNGVPEETPPVVDEPKDEPTTETPDVDEPVVETPTEDEGDEVETPVEDDNTEDDGVVEDNPPQDSTPTEDETNKDEVVDNSAESDVADPSEDGKDATEGDVENA